MAKLIPIECEIKFAEADHNIFHIYTEKRGKQNLVCYGRVFPIKGTKKFIRVFEKEYGTKVTNAREFVREVKAEVKARKEKAAAFDEYARQ